MPKPHAPFAHSATALAAWLALQNAQSSLGAVTVPVLALARGRDARALFSRWRSRPAVALPAGG